MESPNSITRADTRSVAPSPRESPFRLSEEIEAKLLALGGIATVEELTRKILDPEVSDGAHRQCRGWVCSELRAAFWRGELERENLGGLAPTWRYRLVARAH